MLGVCALVLVGEVTNVVEVFLLRGTLGAGNVAFGLVAAALAVGVVVGSVLAGPARPRPRPGPRVALAALALGVTLALAGLAPAIWVFAAAWAFLGVSERLRQRRRQHARYSAARPSSAAAGCSRRVNAMVRGSPLVAMVLGGLAGTLLGPRHDVRRSPGR